ncbi:MAG: hypothetical protein SV375_08995 [Thermodesulfobacteriota bacterium]|nr:hypothetical protein [Thermodesulfobacteriota bacterium]
MSFTTQSLPYPAISPRLLAYTTLYLTIAALIRNLHDRCKTNPNQIIMGQIQNVKKEL